MNDEECGLVMPFVVCESAGGPYNDDAFVAGWTAGTFAEKLSAGELPLGRQLSPFPPGVVPQLDLIAMAEGYALTIEPCVESPDEWVWVDLAKAAS